MRKRRLTAMAGCVTLVAAGLCGSAPAWAVAGDTSAEGNYGFAAKIEVGKPGTDAAAHACGGALVHPQWVLTSASCFSNNGTPANGTPPLASTVTVGRPDLSTTAGSAQSVVQVVSRPDRDVALLKLAAPVSGVTPVAVSANPAAVGQTLHVAGYGRTHTEWVPTRQHVGDFTVQTVNTLTVQTGGVSNATLCKGDAGAPALRDAGDHVELVGVATASAQGGCLGAGADAGHDATVTRLDDLPGWISQTVTPPPPPPPATDWKNARLFASGDYTGNGRSDLIVVWTDGKVSLFPSDGTGRFGSEKVLTGANDRWKNARLITGGDFDGGSRFDLMVVWADGKMSNFVDVSATGLGTEKAMTIPAGTNMSWAGQISAGRFASSAYVTDLVVRWTDGEVTLFTQTGGGKLGTEHQLLKPTTIWKDATLLTSGQFSGKTNWDLMVRWVDGEVDNYPQTSAATGLGTEHRVLNPNTTWAGAAVMTTGHYTANAFVDDIVVRWTDGHTSMFADSTLDRLGTERLLFPAV